MGEIHLIQLAGIIGIGVLTVLIAGKLKLPSILLLTLVGLLLGYVGPDIGFIETKELLGNLLHPIISLSVAIILFEGGLSLNISELKKIGAAVRGLLTIGVLATWVLSSLAAHYVLNLGWLISVMLGSMLVVTGPTVIMPMMRQIRPTGSMASVLKWEGIVIDPIGVTLALLTFEIIITQQALQIPKIIFMTLLFGGGIGWLAAWLLIKMFKRNFVPHFLQNAFTLASVVVVFALSNYFQDEAGLLAVTVMGIMLASQNDIDIHHIVEFKENLQLLLIPAIFIILSSRITIDEIQLINRNHLYFLIVLILVVRPVSVLISTIGSHLPWKEKIFLSWMAPRGIVAAAMASVFAIELEKFGFDNARSLLPTVFLVILGTVSIYGLTAGWLAYLLKLAEPNPQGVLFLGAHPWAQDLAKIIKENGIKVLMIDSNKENIRQAEAKDLPCRQLNILAEHADEEIDLGGLGKLFAVTQNEQVNSMAALRFAPTFGRDRVYQLSSEEKLSRKKSEVSSHIRGRILFSSGVTFDFISDNLSQGGSISTKIITKEDIDTGANVIQPLTIPLFSITPSKVLRVYAADNALSLIEGEILVFLKPSAAMIPDTP